MGVLLTLKLISRSLQQVVQLNSTTTVVNRTDTDTTSKRLRWKCCSSAESPAEATQNITAGRELIFSLRHQAAPLKDLSTQNP